MIRALVVALVCASAPAAFAQTTEPDLATEADLDRAVGALAAIWRPLDRAQAGVSSAVDAACAGAVEEMAAIEAALPPVLTYESLARVRALRGFLIVPTGDTPGAAYFFPSPELSWFTPGLGAVAVLSEGEGFLGVRDAAGEDFALQLGRASGRPILRIQGPDQQIRDFIGCAPVPG